MTIKGKRVLILGSTGLCGRAICREILRHAPGEITLAGLYKEEVEETVALFAAEAERVGTGLYGEPGNIFVRASYKDLARGDLMNRPEVRRVVLSDVIDELNEDILTGSYLFELCERHKPHLIVDCINTATALAYQDIFFASKEVRRRTETFSEAEWGETQATIETHLCSQYLPQLIRHVQIFYDAMVRVGTQMYIKIGTTGTGGMGLNIPYTHSEERPSRVLLGKTSVAGAHSMLLFLMSRTPDAPITKEIKPAAIIAWKSIAFGPVKFRGNTRPLFDIRVEDALALEEGRSYDVTQSYPVRRDRDGQEMALESVYIDTGENGLFSKAEFETITSLGQMECVTAEEIAREVLFEAQGRNSGHDVTAALDQACLGPTYRAGSFRHRALERMSRLEAEHSVDSVAFEMLGPPRLSKLLYEAHLLRKACNGLESIVGWQPVGLSEALVKLIATDHVLRSSILSIGIPILLADGKRLLRGPSVKVLPKSDQRSWKFTKARLDDWCRDGWVDLRQKNMAKWIERVRLFLGARASIPEGDTSSRFERDGADWGGTDHVEIGPMVSWLLRTEDGGYRLK